MELFDISVFVGIRRSVNLDCMLMVFFSKEDIVCIGLTKYVLSMFLLGLGYFLGVRFFLEKVRVYR